MQEQKPMPVPAVSGGDTTFDGRTVVDDTVALDGTKLWDEILKAIVSAMPTQLFPLFK